MTSVLGIKGNDFFDIKNSLTSLSKCLEWNLFGLSIFWPWPWPYYCSLAPSG